jgi:hypothetical protein
MQNIAFKFAELFKGCCRVDLDMLALNLTIGKGQLKKRDVADVFEYDEVKSV